MRPILAAALCLASSASWAGPITLNEAYSLALKRSEQLSQQRNAVEEIRARVDELRSNVKPRLSLGGSEIWQDDAGDAGAGFANNTFTQRSRPQAQLSAHQPLFSGLREFLAVRSGNALGDAAELALQRARQLIYLDVASAYVGLLSVHQEMRSRQALIGLTEDRVKGLRGRAQIGRSRESEVLAAQSQQAQVVSDLESARGRERAAQDQLRFLTGVEEDLFPVDPPLPAQELLAPFLERARKRADVEARRLEARAAELEIGIAARQRWPTLALDGNYYLKRPAGFNEHIRWDVTLSGSLPLYDGGAIFAQTRQAKARRQSAEEALSLAMRSAELQVRGAHAALSSALSTALALEKALALAEANAKAQAADYRLGLVTNLEVLSSLNTALETRLRLDGARLQAVLGRARLEVAAGGVP